MTPNDPDTDDGSTASPDEDAASWVSRTSESHRARAISRRAFLAGAASLPAGLWMNRALAAAGGVPLADSSLAGRDPAAACALPPDVLTRIKRGWDPKRSGQVVIVPRGWNWVSGRISHTTPWHYTADVPMLWYGPGFIRARGAVDRQVSCADIAPTIARLVQFSFTAPDGTVMSEALKDTAPKPKLVVLLVWDAGGRYVLNLHPTSWPHLEDLIPKGTWYSRATTGSSPTSTPPVHATMGTGAFPRTHGVVDTNQRFADGRIGDSWGRGPHVLRVPTLADEYAKAKGSAARTALFATLPWHLGMLGKGAAFTGGARPPVALKILGPTSSSPPTWGLQQRLRSFYRFPSYLNDLPPLKSYWETADLADGVNDGRWRGHDIGSLEGGFITPARVPWQTRAIKEMIVQERLGEHDEPDLLFLNYKIIDEIGHIFYADSVEMSDTIKVQDRGFADLISFLNNRLPGKWAMCLTADHGHTASPGHTGGMAIVETMLRQQVEARFDSDGDATALMQAIRPGWFYMNPAEVIDNDIKIPNVSTFVTALTASKVARPDTIRPGHADDEVFDAVFAGSILPNLSCD
jgi:hypothetical protein